MLFIILLSLALVATMSHAHALRYAQVMTGAPHETRLKLWQKHEQWNGILWVLVFLLLVIVEFSFPLGQMAPRPLIDIPLIVIGLILVVWSRLILGRSGAMGIRWFLPERASAWKTHGPYRLLANPMYDGFILIFIGLGLWRGTIENFYLALASFLLFNIYLAKVESGRQPYRVI